MANRTIEAWKTDVNLFVNRGDIFGEFRHIEHIPAPLRSVK